MFEIESITLVDKVCVFFSIFTMSDFVEQKSSIKFYVRNEISAAETLRMLQKAFGDQALSKTRIFEWHEMFRGGRKRVEDKERPRREKTSSDEQHVMNIKDLVLKNRRLTIRDLADTIGIPRGSVNTVSKDILGRQLVVFASR